LKNQPYKILLVLCLLVAGNQLFAQEAVFDTIMNRIHQDLQSHTNDKKLAEAVAKTNATLDLQGAWPDLHYTNHEFTHLERIIDMAAAYTRPNNKWYGNENIRQKIVLGLQSWLEKNPKHRNWWFNEISYPQQIGQLLITMRYAKTPLPQALEQQLVARMTRKLNPGDGANTSDEALHYLYRACITHNQATMDSAVTYSFEPVSVRDDEGGPQVDNSFYQHGKQQAIASYGRVWIGNSISAAYYLRGTTYAMPADKLAILSSYFKDTYLKTIRGNFYDFNVRGRGISRKDSMMSSMSNTIAKVQLIDPANNDYWNAAYLRVSGKRLPSYAVTPLHTHYWKSNYTLHLRPNYSFNVQANSTRTLRTERGNNENILGKFLPDGATNIQRRGPEYANIMPLWEWDKIPGTTSRDYATDEGSTVQKEWGIPGTTAFAGGLSDSIYGISVYQLAYDSVKANKAWFFFDKEIVCLGSGITSISPEPITTTVNQCWLQENIAVGSQKDKTNLQKEQTVEQYSNPKWAWHDSIGYFFPTATNVQISNTTQSGNWNHINNFQTKDTVRGDVFKMCINHGNQPASATYAYIVVPSIGEGEMKKYALSTINILQNSDTLQAILHTGLNIAQIAFYRPGQLVCNGIRIQVNQPCLLMVKNIGKPNFSMHIADPTQTITELQVAVQQQKAKTKNIVVKLPSGSYAGQTVRAF